MTLHNKIDLQQLLQKWQKRLGLMDWTINVRFSDWCDQNQASGRAHIKMNIQFADIRLLALEDRQENDPCDTDPELDLVHELIHVRLWATDPSDAVGALHHCREQAIEWIAKALITTDRTEIGG